MSSLIWYLHEFARSEWIKKFLFAKTKPVPTPPRFRDFPVVVGECTECKACVTVCPVPGAITLSHIDEKLIPVINVGRCIRCNLCIGACRFGVLIRKQEAGSTN
ncbi:MAG: 4Fe-4S binding protein [Methanocellales archaeon]|nr:4Fe-4S binding protein [Methanocellales archaeon]